MWPADMRRLPLQSGQNASELCARSTCSRIHAYVLLMYMYVCVYIYI